jgi:folate-dependent phosphoribosylglycinamide formyltransferase PurN
MIPADLQSETLVLAEAYACPIVIFTGTALSHERFALRLQADFPALVVGWFQVAPKLPNRNNSPKAWHPAKTARAKLRAMRAGGRRLFTSRIGREVLLDRIQRSLSSVREHFRPVRESLIVAQRRAEERLFGDEIGALKRNSYIRPKIIDDPNSDEIVDVVKSLQPYFILTLGGGVIYGKELRDCARGLALNQHEGWCPEYRGGNPIYWTLYHREFSKVASTIHILTDDMASGPILRRSIVCMAEDDTPQTCLARSIALGTELMCETVREIIATKRARIFPQPGIGGHTYPADGPDGSMLRDVGNDLRSGLIMRDLANRQSF